MDRKFVGILFLGCELYAVASLLWDGSRNLQGSVHWIVLPNGGVTRLGVQLKRGQ
jgi:hypothetical protein